MHKVLIFFLSILIRLGGFLSITFFIYNFNNLLVFLLSILSRLKDFLSIDLAGFPS